MAAHLNLLNKAIWSLSIAILLSGSLYTPKACAQQGVEQVEATSVIVERAMIESHQTCCDAERVGLYSRQYLQLGQIVCPGFNSGYLELPSEQTTVSTKYEGTSRQYYFQSDKNCETMKQAILNGKLPMRFTLGFDQNGYRAITAVCQVGVTCP